MNAANSPQDRVNISLNKLAESRSKIDNFSSRFGSDLSLLSILEKVAFFEQVLNALNEQSIKDNIILDEGVSNELDRLESSIDGIHQVILGMEKDLESI